MTHTCDTCKTAKQRITEAEDIQADVLYVFTQPWFTEEEELRLLRRIKAYREKYPCSCTSQGQSGECTTTTS